MASNQKQYRMKRIQALFRIINMSANMLTYSGKQLDRINFKNFEKIEKRLEHMVKEANTI